MRSSTVTVYEVVYHVADDSPMANGGPMGDGSFTHRTRSKSGAEQFAKGRTYYGKPATVSEAKVSRKTAERWGCV